MVVQILKILSWIQYIVGRYRAYRALSKYMHEKENAYRVYMGEEPKRGFLISLLLTLWEGWVFIFEVLAPESLQTFCNRAWNEPKSQERKVVNKCLWFLLGLSLTWLLLGLSEYVIGARRISKLLIVLLTGFTFPYLMATWDTARGFILILIPMLTGRQVRGLLIGYIVVAVTFGPMENFRHNSHELGRTVSCTAQTARSLMSEIGSRVADFYRATYRAVRFFMQPLIAQLKQLKERLKDTKRLIKDQMKWVADNVKVCDSYQLANETKMAEKREACTDGLKNRTTKMFEYLKYIPTITSIGAGFVGDALNKEIIATTCQIGLTLGKELNEGTVKLCGHVRVQAEEMYNKTKIRAIEEYERAVELMIRELDVRVDVNVSNNNRRKIHAEWNEIWDNIHDDLPKLRIWKIDLQFLYIHIGPYLTFSFTALCVGLAVLYLLKYGSTVRYDNTYITAKIRKIDEDKLAEHKGKTDVSPVSQTLLPLTFTEMMTYVPVFSYRMSKAEISSLMVSMLFFSVAAIYAGIACLLDVTTYWAMSQILGQTRELTPIQLPYGVDAENAATSKYKEAWRRAQHKYGDKIGGTKYGSKALNVTRGYSGAFPLDDIQVAWNNLTSVSFDGFQECVPSLWKPDMDDYQRIWTAIGYLLCAALFAAYVLRLRQLFAGMIFPKQAKDRSIWLYNHILALRSPAVEAIRQYKRMIVEGKDPNRVVLMANISLWDRMVAASLLCQLFDSWILRRQVFQCSKCGGRLVVEDKSTYVECPNQKCQSLFHITCAENLNNTCMDCSESIQRDDPRAVQEEVDSSDESDEDDSFY